jgi:hypothetical protein
VNRRAASSMKARGAAAAKERQRLKDRQHWLISHEYWARCELRKNEAKPEHVAAEEVAKRHGLSVSRVRDIAIANHKEVEDLARRLADRALVNGTADDAASASRIGWEDVMGYCDPTLENVQNLRPPERKSSSPKR